MSVTKPATLTATALADAAIAGDTTMIFASPAALRNVVDTADELNGIQRLALEKIGMLLSAGALVPVKLMDSDLGAVPHGEFQSLYCMTESPSVCRCLQHDQYGANHQHEYAARYDPT